jgi:hypothetical protein
MPRERPQSFTGLQVPHLHQPVLTPRLQPNSIEHEDGARELHSAERLAREPGVTAATPAGWRDDFLAGGQAALKSRPADDRDEEIARLRAKVGELTMDNERLLQRCRGDHPFVPRRRKT